MRFTSFIVAGLFAVAASAQTATSTSSSTSVSSGDPAQSSVASAIEQCLAQCDPSDTKCRANCIAVPSPDNANVNATTSCVAACPQGNGTAADNKAYGDCVAKCIGEYYYTSTGTPNLSTGAAAAGGSSSSATQVPTTITSDGSTFVTSVPATSSGASSSGSSSPQSTHSSSPNAAAVYGPVGTGLGLFGLLAGFIAL